MQPIITTHLIMKGFKTLKFKVQIKTFQTFMEHKNPPSNDG